MTHNKGMEGLKIERERSAEVGVGVEGCFPLGLVKVVLLPSDGLGSSEEMTFIDLV